MSRTSIQALPAAEADANWPKAVALKCDGEDAGGCAFPDVRWGRDPGPRIKNAVTALVGSKGGAWCMRKLVPVDRALLRRSNGRLTILGPFGVPLLLLTTTGKKSGQHQQTPLTYMRERDRLFLAGSNFGQATHPAWTANLIADPNAWVTIGGIETPVFATLLSDSEAARVYRMFADYAANYDAYQGRAHREIRVFALTRR